MIKPFKEVNDHWSFFFDRLKKAKRLIYVGEINSSQRFINIKKLNQGGNSAIPQPFNLL